METSFYNLTILSSTIWLLAKRLVKWHEFSFWNNMIIHYDKKIFFAENGIYMSLIQPHSTKTLTPHPLVAVEGQVILCWEGELPPTYSPTCHIQRIKTWLISLLNVSLRFEIRFKLYTDHKISLAGSYTRPWGTGWKKRGVNVFLNLSRNDFYIQNGMVI